MGVLYKCKGCGLGIDVAAGAAKFPGMTIHCPTCGGKAHYHPTGLGAHEGEIVKVALGEDGTATQPLASLKEDEDEQGSALDDAVESQPTIRVSALETQQVAPVTHRRDLRPPVRKGELRPPSVESVKPSFVKKTDPGPTRTPAGVPFMTPNESKPSDTPSVTRIRNIDIGPSKGGSPEIGPTEIVPARPAIETADTDKGFFKPPDEVIPFGGAPSAAPSPAPADSKKEGMVEGKAWSASVIRRALRASGVDDSGPTESEPKRLDTGLIFQKKEQPQMQVEIPGAGLPVIVEDEKTLNIIPPEYIGESAAEQVVAGKKPRTDPVVSTDDEWDSGVVASVLYRERHRRRQLLFLVFLGTLVGIGVVLGYALDFLGEAPGEDREPPDPEIVVLAQERALRYDLTAIDFAAPFEITPSTEVLDYPRRLFLRLDVTNLSDEAVSALRLSGSWHIVHDAPTQVYSTRTTYEPTPSLAEPLRPGESLTALMEIETDYAPPGQPEESFVWVTLIAMSREKVISEGPVLMVEVPIR